MISTLNRLIETARDGEQGFKTAAEGTTDPQARALFTRYSTQRATCAAELEAEVRRLGGTPEAAGSVSGAVHRGWMNIKTAVTGRDEGAIAAEAERGEGVAVQRYDEALQEDLPPDLQAVVRRQRDQVKEAHDRVRDLERAVSRK